MGIIVANQEIEYQRVKHTQHVGSRNRGHGANEIEALFQIRAAFLLVFQFGRYPHRLAEILLMDPFRPAVRQVLADVAF